VALAREFIRINNFILNVDYIVSVQRGNDSSPGEVITVNGKLPLDNEAVDKLFAWLEERGYVMRDLGVVRDWTD
jgi:hypothetical protein